MSRKPRYVVCVVPPRARKSLCGRPDNNGRLISAETPEGVARMVEAAPKTQTYAGTTWVPCPACARPQTPTVET